MNIIVERCNKTKVAVSQIFDRVKSAALWSANIRKLAKDHKGYGSKVTNNQVVATVRHWKLTLYQGFDVMIWFDWLGFTPLSAIFQLYHGDQFQGLRKPEYPQKTIDHGQVAGKLDHLRLRVECTLFCKLGRARTHAVLVICLYELLCNPTAYLIIQPPELPPIKETEAMGHRFK